MKLTLNDVIRVKEDLQFHYTMFGDIVGEVFKVTTIINDESILVQRCTENGAVTHSDTKRVRNPDMNWMELTDYYDILKTEDQDKLDCERGECTSAGGGTISDAKIADFIARMDKAEPPNVQSGGVWHGPNFVNYWPTYCPDTDTVHPPTPKGEVKSDGGSSSYYDIPIPQWLLEKIVERSVDEGGAYVKTEEITEVAFDNDFSFGTLFKSLVRAKGKMEGAGKAGNTLDYECNKIHYYSDRIKEQGGR